MKKLLLNIPRKPLQGTSWIIKNILTNELSKCSLTSTSDKEMYQNHFSKGFFTVKLGSKRTTLTYLRFTVNTPQCVDTTNSWIWLNLTQDEANEQHLIYSEPNLIHQNNDVNVLPETPFKELQELQ